MTTDRDMTDSERALEQLFAEARADAPLPAPELLERIAADAAALQPAPKPTCVPQREAGYMLGRVKGWLAGLSLPVGLVTAAAAGLWIGFSSGSEIGAYGTSVLDSGVGMYLTHEFPALAGLFPEG